MSNYTRIVKTTELTEIDSKNSNFESKRNREGDRCLFFNREEVNELLGHEVKFYKNGVLLVLLDYAKDFTKEKNPNLKIESKSFIFYNDEKVSKVEDKKPIFEIHNRNRDKETRILKEPVKDIEVKVCEHYLYVKESNLETNLTVEYFVDVLTGEKIFDLKDTDQISFEI